jgi:hypothetical protein
MAARKRESGEAFKVYRENLKREARVLKRKLQGKLLWPGHMGAARRYIHEGRLGLAGGNKFVAYS